MILESHIPSILFLYKAKSVTSTVVYIQARVLPCHPAYENKIGSRVDHITVGYHPTIGNTRCLFIYSSKGWRVSRLPILEMLYGFNKPYPLYVDNFILRHFRRRRAGRFKRSRHCSHI